jgi:hypothetical protein
MDGEDPEFQFQTLRFPTSDLGLLGSQDLAQSPIATDIPMDTDDFHELSATQTNSILRYKERLMSSQDSTSFDNYDLESSMQLDMTKDTEERPKLKRLVRTVDIVSDEEDNESDDEDDEGVAQDQVVANKESNTPPATDERPKTNFLEEEAEVEDDEFMNIGGADGDGVEAEAALREELATFIDEDEEVIRTMTLAEMEEWMKQDEKVRLFFNEQLREKDLKDTKELVKDIATGKILDKRKHKVSCNK